VELPRIWPILDIDEDRLSPDAQRELTQAIKADDAEERRRAIWSFRGLHGMVPDGRQGHAIIL
jgi:hypothetical protein